MKAKSRRENSGGCLADSRGCCVAPVVLSHVLWLATFVQPALTRRTRKATNMAIRVVLVYEINVSLCDYTSLGNPLCMQQKIQFPFLGYHPFPCRTPSQNAVKIKEYTAISSFPCPFSCLELCLAVVAPVPR